MKDYVPGILLSWRFTTHKSTQTILGAAVRIWAGNLETDGIEFNVTERFKERATAYGTSAQIYKDAAQIGAAIGFEFCKLNELPTEMGPIIAGDLTKGSGACQEYLKNCKF